jgi:hypothetical protein
MKRLKTMIMVLRETGANGLIGAYMAFLLICALLIWIAEPGITTYGNAPWYCFTVASTIGFGDVVVQMRLSRILSVVLSFYSAVTLAIVTGVLASYFNRLIQLRDKDSLATLSDKLDRLPDMSREELKRLSEQIKGKFDGK